MYPAARSDESEEDLSSAVRLLFLAVAVAAADGAVEAVEIETLHRLIFPQIGNGRRSLLATEAALRRDTNVAVRALPQIAKHVPLQSRPSVLRTTLFMAAADGEVTLDELNGQSGRPGIREPASASTGQSSAAFARDQNRIKALTKRPGRMAAFSRWLLQQGIDWPPNVIAMTSVTSEKTVSRVAALEKVICPMRGLSVEPLWTPVKLPLKNVDLVILGGESGFGAERFQLEWARDIHNQCKRAEEVSFFMKQLGRRPFEGSRPLKLRDGHGGDWYEWPADLRVREMPRCLYANVAFAESETLATV